MPRRNVTGKLVYDARAWIRNRSTPLFLLDGPVKTEVSFRWWSFDDSECTYIPVGRVKDILVEYD